MKNLSTLVIVFLLLSLNYSVFSQSVSGQWYGVGHVGKDGNYSQYLSELILNQKGNNVTGEYNYYFKSNYIPSKVTGTFNSKTRLLTLTIFPLLNFKASDDNGADCPMKGSFVLKVSKVESVLKGLFETTDQYKYTCPEIAVNFKKEVIKPQDKNKAYYVKNDKKNVEPIAQQAVDKNTQKTNGFESDRKSVNKLTVSAVDKKIVDAAIVTNLIMVDPIEKFSTILKQRLFEESPVIEVEEDSLQLILYDNGEVDDDTVAIFHNRKLIASDQRLSTKPITFTIPIDTSINEISMLAENLGRIPPNTALCIIMAGDKRYELLITSTYLKNGTIRFRKKTALQMDIPTEYSK